MKKIVFEICTFAIVVLATTLFTTTVSAEEPTPGFNTVIPENIMTPDKVETRIGTLEFFDGIPTKETAAVWRPF
jgi:hypothetical protein